MKRSVIALIVLGAIAATAASLLVSSLRISGQQAVATERTVSEETTIVVAAQDLPKSTILDRDMVETKKVLLKDVPQGSVGDSEQAVGKVLAKPIKKGEAFLQTMFAQKLSEALPSGKMLLPVSVHGSTASLELGCTVNVIWTPDPRRGQEAESAMLMSGISVWGIGDRTIVSPDGETGRSSRNDNTVLLLLDEDQTQVITAATQSGFITLPMCNPDDIWAGQDASEVDTHADERDRHVVESRNGDKIEFRKYIKEKDDKLWQPDENQE